MNAPFRKPPVSNLLTVAVSAGQVMGTLFTNPPASRLCRIEIGATSKRGHL